MHTKKQHFIVFLVIKQINIIEVLLQMGMVCLSFDSLRVKYY